MKILIYIIYFIIGISLFNLSLGDNNDINYFSIYCSLVVITLITIETISSYRTFMRYNSVIIPQRQENNELCDTHISYSPTSPREKSTFMLPTLLQTTNIVNKISETMQLSTSIVSYSETERVSQIETQVSDKSTSQEIKNDNILNKIELCFNNNFVSEKQTNIDIDNDAREKLLIPESELNGIVSYGPATVSNEKMVKIPYTERFTPYKSKIFNDIITIISQHYKSLKTINKILSGITYIECQPQKIIVYLQQSISNDFPFKEITDKVQNRMGNTMNVDFAPINTISISEYFTNNLIKKDEICKTT